jgi:hypothetical protein
MSNAFDPESSNFETRSERIVSSSKIQCFVSQEKELLETLLGNIMALTMSKKSLFCS